jgi:hypothetical protein
MEPDSKEKGGFNLKDILLPKKEERSSASASRVNAGALLEQEQKAELPKGEAPPIEPQKRPEGPVDAAPIAPLQTYQTDVERVISQKNVSGIDIVAAESARSQKTNTVFSFTPSFDWSKFKKSIILAGGALLILASASILYYVFLRPVPTVPGYASLKTPFIAVDETQVLVLAPQQFTRSTVMTNLESIKEKTSISLGLMSRIYVTVSTSTIKNDLPPAIDIQSLLSVIAPNAPSEFLRTLDPEYYVLGVHVFDGNQAFLMLRVDSYEQAFSGMLAWERTLAQELAPLFTRTPRPKIPEELSASSTPLAPQISPTLFRDQIVENHDTRVILGEQGDILLLWTFLDRDTLILTTNDATLRELVSRRSSFVPAK